MSILNLRFALILISVLVLPACGGGTSETTSDTNSNSINNNDINDSGNPPTSQTDAVVMVSSSADLSNAHPLDGSTAEGIVYIFFQEGSDWSTRGVRQVVFYCCKNSLSSHTQFPPDSTSTYGIEVDLSQYQDGNYELYIDVFFEDQNSPVNYFINFDIDSSSLPGGSPNNPPTISGSPASSVYENNAYSFAPTANDIDGDGLTFNIVNKPSWAIFNTGTGQLTGTPSNANVGTYSNIIISVTDSADSTSLAPFNIEVMSEPVSPTNNPPTISGSPASSVYENNAYSFTPAANDLDGEVLTFSISNIPSWAIFNTSTGRLTGTPSNADVGTYSNVIISVTDGTDTTSLAPFSIHVATQPTSNGTATLTWIPPTTYTDNTPLTSLGGYKVYYGTSSGYYPNVIDIPNPGITTYVVENLQGNTTHYFVVTAYDANGVESVYSASVSKSIP